MSEESEKAAKWDVVEQYRKSKARLAALENQMHRLGASLRELGRILSEPHASMRFDVGADRIVGINTLTKARLFEVGKEEISWESVTALLNDYQNTEAEKGRLYGQVKEIGLGDIAT